MKSAPFLCFTFKFHSSSRLIVPFLIFFLYLILIPFKIVAQDARSEKVFQQKALLYKNRIKYDSAIIYLERLNVLLERSGDKRGELLNDLEICDIYILQRNYADAQGLLEETSRNISGFFSSDVDLESSLYQLKGSYLLCQG